MAKSFYLLDRKKKCEYKEFEKWWNNRAGQFRDDITSYCQKMNGVLVNEGLAEDVLSGDQIPEDFPISDTSYCKRIGQLGSHEIYRWDAVQYWVSDYDYHDSNSTYHDRNEWEMDILEKILKKYPECIIVDEDNYQVSLDNFKLMCKTGYYKDPSEKN